MTKKCKQCGVEKPYEEYYHHPSTSDGYFARCKICTRRLVAFTRTKRGELAQYAAKTRQAPHKSRPHGCSVCGRVAFYRAGTKYACAGHKSWLMPFIRREIEAVISKVQGG